MHPRVMQKYYSILYYMVWGEHAKYRIYDETFLFGIGAVVGRFKECWPSKDILLMIVMIYLNF